MNTTLRIPVRVCAILGATAVLGAAGGIQGLGACDKEPKMLFKFVDMTDVKLTEKQKTILARIQKKPTTVDLKVVKFQNEALFQNGAPVRLPLAPDKAPMDLNGYKIIQEGISTNFTWSAKPRDSVNLTVRDGDVTGQIYAGDRVYSVESLSGNLHVMVQIDQAKSPPEKNPAEKKDK